MLNHRTSDKAQIELAQGSPGAAIKMIRLRLLQIVSLIFISAPLLGEYAAYSFTGKPYGSLFSSLTMVVATIVNYLFYKLTQNLDRALKFTSFVQLICFCWGLLASGGIYADHLVYLPLFPVINGFIFGKKGSIISAIFATAFAIALAVLAKLGVTALPTEIDSAGLLAYQVIGATILTAFLVVLFDMVRKQAEFDLTSINSILLHEQKALKEKTKALAQSEANLLEAQVVAKIGNWSFHLKSNTSLWSEQLFEFFPEELNHMAPSLDQFVLSFHHEDRAQFSEALKKCVNDAVPYRMRVRTIHSGRTHWLDAIGHAGRDSSGEISIIYGTFQDITDRVESEEENRFILKSLGIGVWKWDIATNALEWDENMYKLYGADPKDFNGAYDAWEKSLSPETKTKAIDEIHAAVRGEKEFDTTFQVVHKTGFVQEIRTRAFVIRDAAGVALKMWGINIDRTREAELERSIETEKVLQRAILNSVSSEIAVLDKDGTIVAVNDPWVRFSKDNAKDNAAPTLSSYVGENYVSVCHACTGPSSDLEVANRVVKGIQDVMARRQLSVTLEYECHSLTQQRWYSMSINALRLDAGGVVISHTEITEKILADRERERFSKFLNIVLQNIPSMLFVKDCNNEFRFTLINKAGQSIMGIDEANFVGKSDYDYFSKEIADGMRQKDREVIAARRPLNKTIAVWRDAKPS